MPMEARASIQPASSIAFFIKEHQTSLLTMLVSHTALCIMEQIASKLLYFIFGVAELILTFVGGVDAAGGSHFGS
jgi:hypothetical protein